MLGAIDRLRGGVCLLFFYGGVLWLKILIISCRMFFYSYFLLNSPHSFAGLCNFRLVGLQSYEEQHMSRDMTKPTK